MENHIVRIEFYLFGGGMLASTTASAVPVEGEFINIKKITYRVVSRTWALDDADDPRVRRLRANIDLEPMK